MARERYGNGYKGRAATRRRMRSHDHGYVGSEKARPCVYSHGPIVGLRKGLEVEMSENLAEHYALPTPQEVEDEIPEQRSIGVTAHVQSGVS